MSDSISNEGMKLLIDKMNKCAELSARRGQVAVTFDLPQIVVIGSQSSGKSSVLEGIVGREFLPRGPDMVTRCPLVLQLHYDGSIPANGEYAVFAEDEFDREKRVNNFSHIAIEIDQRTVGRTSQRKGISSKPIILNIYSSAVVNLQLVDLPGFVMNPLPDQPEDIQRQIEDLVDSYIRRPNTLILAISPATDDIANSVAIKTAKKVDEDCKRTIGVITKIDMVRGEEAIKSLIRVLENVALPLEKGYVGVVNRSQEQVENRTQVESVRKEEDQFFRTGQQGAFAHLSKRMGTQYLQKFLNREFAQVIQAKVPEFIIAGESKLRSIEEQLNRLEYSSKVDSQSGSLKVMNKISDFTRAVVTALEGNSARINSDELDAGAEIKKTLQKLITSACAQAMMVDDKTVAVKMSNIVENLDGAHDAVLPNSLAFRIVVSMLSDQFKDPLSQLVESITRLLNHHLKKIADKNLSINPKLKIKILEIVLKKVDDSRGSCVEDMKRQIEVQKIYINSSHPDFERYKKLILGRKKIDRPSDEPEDNGDSDDYHSEEDSSGPGVAGASVDAGMSYSRGEPISIRTIVKGANGLFSSMQSGAQSNRSEGVIRAPTDLQGKTQYFLELVYAYMRIVVDKTLNDMAQRLVMFHMVHNVCQYLNNPEIHHQILGLENGTLSEDDYQQLLETNGADQNMIKDLLADQSSIQETIKILSDKNSLDEFPV